MNNPPTRFTKPTVIAPEHDSAQFMSGEDVLDDWLRNRALENLSSGASRTYVTCADGTNRIAAYYALAMGSIAALEVPGSMRRNMPRLIPSVVLGRLAVDASFQGKGLGAIMLQDAVHRTLRASQEISARLLLVHALSPKAEAFYQHHGFKRLPIEAPVLALDLVKVAGLLAE